VTQETTGEGKDSGKYYPTLLNQGLKAVGKGCGFPPGSSQLPLTVSCGSMEPSSKNLQVPALRRRRNRGRRRIAYMLSKLLGTPY